MPRYIDINGKRAKNVKLEKSWVVIPIKPTKESTPKDEEHYLVSTRVADYIVLLESKIDGKLPMLKPKKRKI